MAAAVIPLITSLAPSIVELITSLVHRAAPAAEAKLGGGTGPVKFAEVFASVVSDLGKAAAAGKIDKTLPSDDLIKLIIESVVTSLNLSGQLGSAPVVSAPVASQSITLSAGQSITITVK